MQRRGFLGSVVALVAGVAAKASGAGREWVHTNEMPINQHVQVGGRFLFSGEAMDARRDLIHSEVDRILDAILAKADADGLNVWRLGEIRLRVRMGRYEKPGDIRSRCRHPLIDAECIADGR